MLWRWQSTHGEEREEEKKVRRAVVVVVVLIPAAAAAAVAEGRVGKHRFLPVLLEEEEEEANMRHGLVVLEGEIRPSPPSAKPTPMLCQPP